MDVEQTPPRRRNRGKLYRLTSDSSWEDLGTGFTSVVGQGENRRLVFQEESTGAFLHDRKVWKSDAYQLQGEGDKQTIIVWEDPETQQDLALSFQDLKDIAEVWNIIRQEKRLLALPTLETLPELSRALSLGIPPSQREAYANECISDAFIDGLVAAFRQAEDLKEEELLFCLFRIVKGAFFLSNQKLSERFLRSDVYLDVLGILEYDEGLPLERRIPHRQVHALTVNFKQAVTFDSAILDRVHLIYRLQYVKDRALPRAMDDATFSQMTQMVHSNLSAVLDYVQKNGSLLEVLFSRIRQGDVQSLYFLQELCRLARQIPPAQRQALHERLSSLDLFDLLAWLLRDGRFKTHGLPQRAGEAQQATPRHVAVEVLLLAAQCDAAVLRRRLTGASAGPVPAAEAGGKAGRPLLSALIQALHTEDNQGVQSQVSELLRVALDPAGLEGASREQCLRVFHEGGGLEELVQPLRSGEGPTQLSSCFAAQAVCELLGVVITAHGAQAKAFMAKPMVVEALLRLSASEQRFLQLAPVRLVRMMVQTKDEIYVRLVVRSGLLAPMLQVFVKCQQPPALGGGLYVSAILKMLEIIDTDNVKLLVAHLCQRHEDILVRFAPRFKICQNLLLRHSQNLQAEQAAAAAAQRAAAANAALASGGPPVSRDRTSSVESASSTVASSGETSESEDGAAAADTAGTDPYQSGGQEQEQAGPAADQFGAHEQDAAGTAGSDPYQTGTQNEDEEAPGDAKRPPDDNDEDDPDSTSSTESPEALAADPAGGGPASSDAGPGPAEARGVSPISPDADDVPGEDVDGGEGGDGNSPDMVVADIPETVEPSPGRDIGDEEPEALVPMTPTRVNQLAAAEAARFDERIARRPRTTKAALPAVQGHIPDPRRAFAAAAAAAADGAAPPPTSPRDTSLPRSEGSAPGAQSAASTPRRGISPGPVAVAAAAGAAATAVKRAGSACGSGGAVPSKGKGRGRPQHDEPAEALDTAVSGVPATAAFQSEAEAEVADKSGIVKKLLLSHAPKRMRTSPPAPSGEADAGRAKRPAVVAS